MVHCVCTCDLQSSTPDSGSVPQNDGYAIFLLHIWTLDSLDVVLATRHQYLVEQENTKPTLFANLSDLHTHLSIL